TPRVAKASPFALSRVTALWVGSIDSPPPMGSVTTAYRIDPHSRRKATASPISTGLARIRVARRRGHFARQLARRDVRPTFGQRTFVSDGRRVFTPGQRSRKWVRAVPIAERRFLNQIVARPKRLRRVAATKTAICR